MDKVLGYIEKNIESDFTVKMLADLAGYSEFYFIKKFKEQIKCTPMEYVWRRKLVRATEEIATGKKIIDIAYQYGFHTQSAFDKAFRRAFGISPSFLKSIRMGINQMNEQKDNYIFLNTIKEGTTKEELLSILKGLMDRYQIRWDQELTDSLYRLCCRVYEGRLRYSGEEYVIHPLNMACILAEMEVEYNVIMAALFADTTKKGFIPLEDIKDQLPSEIYEITSEVQGDPLKLNDLSENGMLIFMAQRLHNMRTFQYVDPAKRARKIKETIEFYLPVARLLDNRKLMDELNDLVMKYS